MPRLRIWRFVSSQCVSLFYVIDTGSIRPRARILGGPRWRLPIYPSPLAQTLAMHLPLPLLGAPVDIGALVKLGSRSLAKQDLRT